MQEVTRFRMTTHPVEFDMYYAAVITSRSATEGTGIAVPFRGKGHVRPSRRDLCGLRDNAEFAVRAPGDALTRPGVAHEALRPFLSGLRCRPRRVGRAAEREVYRCPATTLYTDTISAKEAQAKGCRTLEGAPMTVCRAPAAPLRRHGRRRRRRTARSPARVDPGAQRARDSDARASSKAS